MTDQHQKLEQVMKALGERIKTRRNRKGLSQMALAQLSGLSVRAISQIERGAFKVTLADLYALAPALQTQISLLLQGLA